MVQTSSCPKSERSNEPNVQNPNKTSLNTKTFGFWYCSVIRRSAFGIPLQFSFHMFKNV